MKKTDWTLLPPLPPDLGCILGGPVVLVLSTIATSWTFNTIQPLGYLPIYWLGIGLSFVGLGLLFLARLPLYRRKQFFRWGIRSLPPESHGYYRWAYRLILPGIICLLMFLVFSKLFMMTSNHVLEGTAR